MGGSSKKKLIESTIVRVFYDVVLTLSILFAPWQVIFVLGIFGAFLFPRFIEIIIAGVLFDLLYAPTGVGLTAFFGTISSIFLYGSIEYAKTHLRGY